MSQLAGRLYALSVHTEKNILLVASLSKVEKKLLGIQHPLFILQTIATVWSMVGQHHVTGHSGKINYIADVEAKPKK